MIKIIFVFLGVTCIVSFIIAIKYWKKGEIVGVLNFIITTILSLVGLGLNFWPQKAAELIPGFANIIEENNELKNGIQKTNEQITMLENEINSLKLQNNIEPANNNTNDSVKEEDNMDFETDFKINLTTPELQIEAKDIDVFQITWNEVNNADGYELYYSTNGKYYKKLIKTKKTTYKHKNLIDRTKYYYKIKAYVNTNSEIIYSKYSKVHTKKCTYYLVDFYSAYETKNVDIYSKNSAYNEYKNGSTFTMGGINYSNGFVFGYTDWYNGHDYANRNMSAFFNLEGKYKSISFIYACIDGHAQDSIIKIYSDDECIKELTFGSGDLPKKITINVLYANKLEIAVYGNHIGLANVKLYK